MRLALALLMSLTLFTLNAFVITSDFLLDLFFFNVAVHTIF